MAISLWLLLVPQARSTEADVTTRIPQFSNERVIVWETIIYPNAKHQLPMHRHDQDRVLVSFDEGTLKITNDKGQTHYLKLEKNNAYYLTKDVPGELHTDENMTNHPIKVLVITLKD
jgi:hypothetical protein